MSVHVGLKVKRHTEAGMKQVLLLSSFLIVCCMSINAQIYRVAQMSSDQIGALDKQKTVVILTGGILEEHGPHLPSFSDGYSNEWLTQRLAEAIVRRPATPYFCFQLSHWVTEARMKLVISKSFLARIPSAAQPCALFSWTWLLNSASKVLGGCSSCTVTANLITI